MKAETCEIRTTNKPKCLFKKEETIRERLTVNHSFTISTFGHSIVKLLQNKAFFFFTFSFHRLLCSSFFYHIAAIFFSLFSFFFLTFFFLIFLLFSTLLPLSFNILLPFSFNILLPFSLLKICSCKGHKLLFAVPAFPQAVPHLNIDQICRFLTSVI